ncbi:MAG: hypothetical protein O2960_28630 [Verrucomicrobia bacterium]|nr:hypothetical protein [Verrucomicrobiota bacterium]
MGTENNGFPHPSPDGKWLLFLSSEEAFADAMMNEDITLKLMSLPGGTVQVLAKLYGDSGAIRANSWSPDIKRVVPLTRQLKAPHLCLNRRIRCHQMMA